ncbi:DUF1163 domain-containing protein [Agrobacterium cavarae]|uniref:DUF1163 domain-containing protein n=1 Tax=Agrobacterium cavarae TaxID=2528239 RepID=A0ABY1YDV6_9HYPH|nr:DUF1163 domain-containing protein [Agrobacterium cavarae]
MTSRTGTLKCIINNIQLKDVRVGSEFLSADCRTGLTCGSPSFVCACDFR